MLAKTLTVLLPLTVVLAGCTAQDEVRQRATAGTVRPAPPSRERLALESAVALAAELKYDQAAGKLAGLAPRLHAAGDRTGAAEAMFWLGYCLEKQRRYELARHWYGRVRDTYPGTPAARLAGQRLGGVARPVPGAGP